VLIIVEGVHQEVPDTTPGIQPVYIGNSPPGAANPAQPTQPAGPTGTEADRLQSAYKTLGQQQGHDYGDNPVGTKPADFTKLGQPAGTAPPAKTGPAAPPVLPNAAPKAAPNSTPPANPPPARRSNQAAGGPPGGQIRR
jgi:hypothetical protein